MECKLSNQPLRLVVMISGGGSNLQALIDAIKEKSLDAKIIHVISNRKNAYGLERAQKYGIPTTIVSLKPYKVDGRGREQFDIDLAEIIKTIEPDLVVLAGWMHILSEPFLTAVGVDVINLHPALPNMFAGINAIERAYEAFQRGEIVYSGCMIHHVIPEIDAGDVIVQADVPILRADTLESFASRMHQTEHRIIVEAVKTISVNR
jgi:formyltetrahydrofolate-dependent phosphoribosylglycinamide formyltransferase